MDCRNTLHINETFLEMLQAVWRSGDKANLLLDDNGMARAEGIIKTIHTNVPMPFIELESGTKIILKTIIAVNGVFLPEYSGC